ncbi:MAG: endonuclease/exonuclease/phosphatase family protein, partial [Cyanobacteria bacterium J06553_1]
MLADCSPVCVCLQETMVGDAVVSPPRGYSGFYSPPNPAGGHRGGCAVYVHLGVPFIHFPLQSPLQAVAVQIHLERRVTIVSLYLPPNNPVARGDLEMLVRQLPRPFLLLGDLNGRHLLWGDNQSNPRGDLLSSWIEDMDLGVLNTGEPTHFHIQTGSFTAIDLSICSSDALLDYNWEVKEDLHGSDHFPIILRTARGIPCPRAPRWRLDKADWTHFRDLSEMLNAMDEFPSVDVAVKHLTDTLYNAGLQAIPRTTGKFSRRPVPWWSLDLTVARKAKRAAYTRYRRHKC